MARLLLHLLHQPRTLDDIGKARIVLDIRGDGHLPAGLEAMDDDRLQTRARRVDCGGEPRRTGSENEKLRAHQGSFRRGRYGG